MREGLPQEIQDWLQDINAHKEAAERVAMFYNTFLGLTNNENAALMLTQSWMMVLYGFPKNMPFGQQPSDES